MVQFKFSPYPLKIKHLSPVFYLIFTSGFLSKCVPHCFGDTASCYIHSHPFSHGFGYNISYQPVGAPNKHEVQLKIPLANPFWFPYTILQILLPFDFFASKPVLFHSAFQSRLKLFQCLPSSGAKILFPLQDLCIPSVASRPGVL